VQKKSSTLDEEKKNSLGSARMIFSLLLLFIIHQKENASMKKHLSLILLLSTAVGAAHGHGNVYSHSFFSMKPHFQMNSPEAVALFRNDRMESRECGYGSAFELVTFGGRSEKENDLAKYFLPWGKSSIVVQEIDNYETGDHVDGVYDRDVDARHLNIQTNNGDFKSTVCFAPHHTFFGVALDWKQALSYCSDGAVNWFFEVSAPLVHVRNDMHMVETIENDGGGVMDVTGLDGAPRVGNATDAFKQANWLYGKILSCDSDCSSCSDCSTSATCSTCSTRSCCDSSCETSCSNNCSDSCKKECDPYKKTRLADIELRIGKNVVHSGCCRLDSYVGMIFPTGNKPTGEYLFEAIVGNNKHWGIMWGANLEMNVFECNNHHFRLAIDTNTRYLFQNKQHRSFDLFDSPWSRYMEMYENEAAALAAEASQEEDGGRSGTSGINIMTQCVKVAPRFSTAINSAIRYNYCQFIMEAGYGMFTRQAEHIDYCWQENAALKYFSGGGNTSVYRTIDGAAHDTSIPATEYRPFPEDWLNIASGAHPSVLLYTLFGSIGYNFDTCYPMFVGIGGSYDFGTSNTMLNQWQLWGKVGITF